MSCIDSSFTRMTCRQLSYCHDQGIVRSGVTKILLRLLQLQIERDSRSINLYRYTHYLPTER